MTEPADAPPEEPTLDERRLEYARYLYQQHAIHDEAGPSWDVDVATVAQEDEDDA